MTKLRALAQPAALFEAGLVIATPDVMGWALQDQRRVPLLLNSLMRHLTGDWGDVDATGACLNDVALDSGRDRIVSAYALPGRTVWIITESDHATTTLQLRSDT